MNRIAQDRMRMEKLTSERIELLKNMSGRHFSLGRRWGGRDIYTK